MFYPALNAHAVTPSDTVVLPGCRALYVGGDGDVSVKMQNNPTPVVLKGVLAGSILPIAVASVMSTGTTATNIVALY